MAESLMGALTLEEVEHAGFIRDPAIKARPASSARSLPATPLVHAVIWFTVTSQSTRKDIITKPLRRSRRC